MMSRRALASLAYGEFKVTRQIATGNGEMFLAATAHPPGSFVQVELGFGINERPCSDCHRPCTLDYTLQNLDEINGYNLLALNNQDPLGVPERISSVRGSVRKHFKLPEPPAATGELTAPPRLAKHRMSAKAAKRALRAQARRAGIRVVKGQYVDDRERTWVPRDPNALGRRKSRTQQLINAHRKQTKLTQGARHGQR
jgi:hypothetical protein